MLRKIRILVVDDHPMLRDGVRALISLYTDMEMVGEAGDGNEAVEKVQELAPDVIIMDIAMPRMDGLEATRRITSHSPQAKVLILSQHADKEYVLSAVRAGAVGYLPKTALGSELIFAIRAVNQGDSFLHPAAAAALIEDYRQKAEGDSFDRLTAREREILKLVAEGHTSQEIADTLFISPKTVLGHRAKLMEKLGIVNRTELIKYAMRKGLVTLEK